MSFGISLHVWGDYACFTRPELKAERMSYEVMTPSAARGILTAIYWKPEMRWVVDRIHVLSPIRFTQVRRNEVGNIMTLPSKAVMEGKKTATLGMYIEDCRQQRASMILRDVNYVIDAHVEVVQVQEGVNSIAKHLEMFKRRARQGQCFHQPYFGTREFPVSFELVESPDKMPPCHLPPEQLNRNLGLMLHDMVYTEEINENKINTITPSFFLAEIKNGIVHVSHINNLHV